MAAPGPRGDNKMAVGRIRDLAANYVEKLVSHNELAIIGRKDISQRDSY